MGVDKHYRKVVGKKAEFKEMLMVSSSPLTAVSAAGTPFSLLNPISATAIVTQVIIDITTAVNGTPCTLNCGIGASAAGDYDTLIDGLDIGTPTGAAGVRDNIDDQGTNGQATENWGATEYLNVTTSGSTTGMVATIYIWYRKAA